MPDDLGPDDPAWFNLNGSPVQLGLSKDVAHGGHGRSFDSLRQLILALQSVSPRRRQLVSQSNRWEAPISSARVAYCRTLVADIRLWGHFSLRASKSLSWRLVVEGRVVWAKE